MSSSSTSFTRLVRHFLCSWGFMSFISFWFFLKPRSALSVWPLHVSFSIRCRSLCSSYLAPFHLVCCDFLWRQFFVESLRSPICRILYLLRWCLMTCTHFTEVVSLLRWSPYFFLLLYRALLVVHLFSSPFFKYLVQVASKLSMYVYIWEVINGKLPCHFG